MREVALYIHIPFCVSKCAYCDFASYPNRLDDVPRYVTEVLAEMRAWKDALSDAVLPTVYIGGGTPSLLPEEELQRLMDGVRACFAVKEGAEVTAEANPGTLSPKKLTAMRRAGINRLSLGVQSFDDGLLRGIGRIHTAEEARESVLAARGAGFENLSVDLIYGLPEQTCAQWEDTLSQAIALKPKHISAYSLIVEEGTRLFADVASGRARPADEESVLAMQNATVRTLAAAGYARYEISNYALEGYASRHNSIYWRRGEYLGVGCAAHSLIGKRRFCNPRGLNAYLSGVRRENLEVLTPEDEKAETLMLSTRMCEGMDLNRYKAEFGEDFVQTHAKTVENLRQMGYLTIEDAHLRLTQKGMDVQNAVLMQLMS